MPHDILPRLPHLGANAADLAALPGRGAILRPSHAASTAGLDGATQFAAWRAQCGPVLALEEPPRPGGFRAHCTAWKLGPFGFVQAVGDGLGYRRERVQLRRDALDHWVIRVSCRGGMTLRTAAAERVIPVGQPVVLSLAQPFEARREDSAWLSLIVPRDVFPSLARVLDGTLHAPLPGNLGLLLGRYMQILDEQMPEMLEAELPRLVAATRAMVAACIVPTPEHQDAAAPMLEHARMERVRQAIRQNLCSPTLTPGRLCRMVGMSRSQLYRLFEPMGGVARYIQAERLREAHRALSDPGNPRSIHDVAEDLGFFDASAFSRIFRREFGCAPSEVRAAACSGGGEIALQRPSAPASVRSLTDLLRALQ